ncbi:MAG: MtnX-like HAD-IB family phosphatase [Tepidisphaeraceae bacterium]
MSHRGASAFKPFVTVSREIARGTGGTTTIPPADRAQVFIDFDGTITQVDVIDDLIRRYAVDDSWKTVEEQWQRGEIGSRECLSREFDVIRVSPADLSAFLAEVPLDPGARELFSLLREHRVPVSVLSDGVDLFINHILDSAGLGSVIVRSNAIERHGDRLRLVCPHHVPSCPVGAAHCKCASAQLLQEQGRRSIYIGDGRSDLCAARKAGCVFAKGALAASLKNCGTPCTSFSSLTDVRAILDNAWSGVHA